MNLFLCDLFWSVARKVLQIYKNYFRKINVILTVYSVVKPCNSSSELMYLTPVSNFPLRTWIKITACCGLWLCFAVTLASSSTTFDCAFFLSISTRHWALWNNKRHLRLNNWPWIVWNSDPLNVTKTWNDLFGAILIKCFLHSFVYIEVSSSFEVRAPNEFYLTPISNFPLRAWTKITARCGLWFVSSVTFSSPSTALYGSFFFPIPARNRTLWNNDRVTCHLSGRRDSLILRVFVKSIYKIYLEYNKTLICTIYEDFPSVLCTQPKDKKFRILFCLGYYNTSM